MRMNLPFKSLLESHIRSARVIDESLQILAQLIRNLARPLSSQNDTVVESSRNVNTSLVLQILHKLWIVAVLYVSMSQLSVVAPAKSEHIAL